MEQKRGAMGFGVGQKRERKTRRIDDAALGRVKSPRAHHPGLPIPQLLGSEKRQSGNAVGQASIEQSRDADHFALVDGDDQFSHFAVGHASPLEPGIQKFPAPNAERGLQTSRRRIDPSVNDLAVPRGHFPSDAPVTLHHQNRSTAPGQGRGRREPHHSSPHHHHIYPGAGRHDLGGRRVLGRRRDLASHHRKGLASQ